MSNFKECSICFWININSWNTSYETYFHAGKNSYSWTDYIFGILRNAANSTVCFTIGNGSTASNNNYLTSAWSVGEWMHVAFIYSTGKCKIYLNGNIDKEYDTSIVPDFTKITKITIGHSNGSAYQTNCKMNDFRIYDHALSPLEVKEISKGLILHYPLNRGGWGQENLATNTSFPNSNIEGYGGQKAIEYNHSDWTSGGRYFAGDSNSRLTFTEIQANQPYIISAWVYIYSDVTLSNPGGTSVFYRIYKTGDSPTYSYDIYFDLSGITERNKWVKVSRTFVSSYTYTYNQGGTFQIGGYNGHFKVSMPKVEKGSIATPWCPNSSDVLATTMRLNDNVEYDVSGYCNNGTRIGTFNWTSNTPKYNVSQVFNGVDNAIQTPNLTIMITDKNYTIAVWIYKTAIGSKSYQTIYGGPNGFEIEARNGGANETKFVPWNWGKPMASYELNEWNHCVFVHSDSDCKIYLNGEYIATGTAKAANPSGNYFVGAWNTATQQNFDGLMSDFRIYATALSADDVKSLYQNSAYIDNQGNIYGAVYEEV